ncbi:protealysin inhibitor emfourin [Streptomyces sp. AC495_CC817]|uniref:protealysin inhibitor emfourin n=1 Tax=Streptomyces sp. AC495_CC817 TaxID=2823900 RepID=UPI001C262BE2|nr:protealysin inhibitor emfourin [Streptomyces sp. AC495_CC817]
MSDSRPSTDDQFVIAVVRTGGIAGLRRRWSVEPPPSDTGDWIALIESCPWDAPRPDTEGADRFVWSIRVRTPSERLEQELPDTALDGPWLALVKAVREASD